MQGRVNRYLSDPAPYGKKEAGEAPRGCAEATRHRHINTDVAFPRCSLQPPPRPSPPSPSSPPPARLFSPPSIRPFPYLRHRVHPPKRLLVPHESQCALPECAVRAWRFPRLQSFAAHQIMRAGVDQVGNLLLALHKRVSRDTLRSLHIRGTRRSRTGLPLRMHHICALAAFPHLTQACCSRTPSTRRSQVGDRSWSS